jgi:hypothetical protein
MTPIKRYGVAVAALVVLSTGCNDIKNLFSSAPGSPSSTSSPQSFTGTLAVGGASIFTFTVAQAGTVNVTLTALGGSSPVGLGIGTPNGTSSCQLSASSQSTTAGASPQLTAKETAGTYCVSVFDTGALAAATTFAVSVSQS